MVGEQTERVGVSLEVDKVTPLSIRQMILEADAFAFAEEGGDGFLAVVSEWRVAEVVA